MLFNVLTASRRMVLQELIRRPNHPLKSLLRFVVLPTVQKLMRPLYTPIQTLSKMIPHYHLGVKVVEAFVRGVLYGFYVFCPAIRLFCSRS